MIKLDVRVIKWYLPNDSLTIFDYLFIIIGFYVASIACLLAF